MTAETNGNGQVIDLHPDAVNAEAVLRLASKAARCSEEAVQKATAAFDESRRTRSDVKHLRAEVAALKADSADATAALLVGLSTIAHTADAQSALAEQVKVAAFNAKAARQDAVNAEERAGETTGRYNLSELQRQSIADTEDRAIIQQAAKAFLTQEQKDKEEKRVARVKRNAMIWRGARAVGLVLAAFISSLLASHFGVHL